jgi:hypothetical protein
MTRFIFLTFKLCLYVLFFYIVFFKVLVGIKTIFHCNAYFHEIRKLVTCEKYSIFVYRMVNSEISTYHLKKIFSPQGLLSSDLDFKTVLGYSRLSIRVLRGEVSLLTGIFTYNVYI